MLLTFFLQNNSHDNTATLNGYEIIFMSRQIKLNTWDLKSIPYKLEKWKLKVMPYFIFVI